MDGLHFPLTMGEYVSFHAMDRSLYSKLAIDLWRDPNESMCVMAFWLWIERHGYKNFILYLLSVDTWSLNKYADEAVKCLQSIDFLQVISQAEASGIPAIPLTTLLLKDKIPIRYVYENKKIVVKEIENIFSEVCAKALSDLVENAHKKHKAFDSWATNLGSLGFVGENSQTNHHTGPSKEDRTLFITFSRGFPISEEEVKTFFTTFYGDCIEAFHMQSVNPLEQALYARIVLNNPSVVNNILNGTSKAKFSINGKHLWVRKFLPKHKSTS